MILRFLAVTTLCSSFAFANNTSHRQAAAEMLDLVSGPETIKASLSSVLTPMLNGMKDNGTSDDAVNALRAAFTDWLETEIRWDELRPQMVELYVSRFSESELRELTAFYRSPVGKKALNALPGLVAEGAKIGQAYAKSKEAALQQRLQKVAEKHRLPL
jgi:hypothetical protein